MALLLLASPSAVRAQALTEAGLEAFLPFDEGGGTFTADLTGNGHDGTVVGSVTWGAGHIRCTSEGQVINVATGPALQVDSFTYDLWFEAASTTGAYGRLAAQADSSGGSGPDLLESYGYAAIRITRGSDVVFEAPTVGSLSTPAPPNHFGVCADAFHREAGPEHLVLSHDEPSKLVRLFQGLEGAPLRLCFEATYTGSYSTDTGPLGIGNHPSMDNHVFRGRYFQFAYYSRTLTFQVDGSRNVTGGELLDNHLAGSDATLAVPPEPDAGVVDAAVTPGPDAGLDAAVVPDGAGAGDAAVPDAGPDGGVSSGCACTSAGGGGCLPVWLGLLLLLWLRRRRLLPAGRFGERRGLGRA